MCTENVFKDVIIEAEVYAGIPNVFFFLFIHLEIQGYVIRPPFLSYMCLVIYMRVHMCACVLVSHVLHIVCVHLSLCVRSCIAVTWACVYVHVCADVHSVCAYVCVCMCILVYMEIRQQP